MLHLVRRLHRKQSVACRPLSCCMSSVVCCVSSVVMLHVVRCHVACRPLSFWVSSAVMLRPVVMLHDALNAAHCFAVRRVNVAHARVCAARAESARDGAGPAELQRLGAAGAALCTMHGCGHAWFAPHAAHLTPGCAVRAAIHLAPTRSKPGGRLRGLPSGCCRLRAACLPGGARPSAHVMWCTHATPVGHARRPRPSAMGRPAPAAVLTGSTQWHGRSRAGCAFVPVCFPSFTAAPLCRLPMPRVAPRNDARRTLSRGGAPLGGLGMRGCRATAPDRSRPLALRCALRSCSATHTVQSTL